MPSSRVPTTPQNATVSSNTNTPDFQMNITPPGTPASPHSSVQTPRSEQPAHIKFRNVPAHLNFFLQSTLDLDSRSTTKALIQQVIKHFEPDLKTTQSMTKPHLKCLFYEHVSPLIRDYNSAVNSLNTTPVSSPSRINGSNLPLDYNSYAHAFNPSFDPNHSTSTKKILYAAIRHKSPGKSIAPLNQIKKPDLVALFERYVHQAPAPPVRFAQIPPVLAASELSGQTKDELRFALQAHIPTLFMMSHVTKLGLINIYKRFMLGETDTGGLEAQAQIDFSMINNQSS